MDEEQRIAAIVTNWAQAIERKDRNGILAAHSDDIIMFDFPNIVRGIDAYAKTWDFFDESRRGEVTFAPSHVEVTAGDKVAFAHCEMHCEGTTAGPIDFRLTFGLTKQGADWIITHEHHSMPTENDTLIGPDVEQ